MNQEEKKLENIKKVILCIILLIAAGAALSLYSSFKGDSITGIRALTVDTQGNVYIIANFTLYKLDRQGKIIFKTGEEGSGPGQFGQGIPLDLCVDKNGFVYAADILNYRIQKFDAAGKFVSSFGRAGTEPGAFGSAMEIAVDTGGCIYTVESTNNRLQKFDPAGKLLFVKGGMDSRDFDFPHDPLIARDGAIYIADFRKARVQSFSPEGRFVDEFKTFDRADKGSRPRELTLHHYPQRIAQDSRQNFYVLNYDPPVTQGILCKYDPAFKFMKEIDAGAKGADFISYPAEIACGPDDALFLIQDGQLRITRIDTQGAAAAFGSPELLAELDALSAVKQNYASQGITGRAMAVLGALIALAVFFWHRRAATKETRGTGLIRKIE